VPVGFQQSHHQQHHAQVQTQSQQQTVKYHPIIREGTGGRLVRDASLDSDENTFAGASLRRASEHGHKAQQEYRKSSTRSADIDFSELRQYEAPSAAPGDRNSIASVRSLDTSSEMMNRMRRSFEKKEEFLMRTESPTFSMPKQFYPHPQRIDGKAWPPAGEKDKGTDAYDALLQAMSHAMPHNKLTLSLKQRSVDVDERDHRSSSESIPMIDSSPPADVRHRVDKFSALGGSFDSAPSSAGSPLNRYFNQLSHGGPRVPSLRLVSRRAHQFETGAVDQETSNKLPFYQSELARLSVKTPPTTVEVIKQGFERSSDREPRSTFEILIFV
jgi:hypothetical protein